MDKPRNYYKDTYHHLYNRGANKQKIFFDEENYIFFLKQMKYYKEKYNIEILSYCLMPNHFHMFVHQLTVGMSVSKFISSLLNSYTKSVNKHFNRSGTFFQGKTKSKQIENDTYWKWLLKYILYNPVEAGLVHEITDWNYSNAKDLLCARGGTLTNISEIRSYFQNESVMIEFLSDKKLKVDFDF